MTRFLLLVVLAAALAGCGKKGDLKPPPGYTKTAPTAVQSLHA